MTASVDYKSILTSLCDGHDLTADQMTALMRGVLAGDWTPAQTAGALVALKIKGEKPGELAAAAAAMRSMAVPVEGVGDDVVDTCGTGGDGARAFNISTAAAFVAAACGVRVAKHGNRAVSGSSGSFDVLDALGMPANLSAAAVARLINEVGVGFMFAPNHHAAVKHAMPVRRELGVRTMFNLLGPLTNPAGARRQVVGVFSRDLLLPYAEALAELGAVRALVAHGDGLDEVAISGETDIAEVKDGAVVRYVMTPEQAGLRRAADKAGVQVASVAESKNMLLSALDGKPGPARDIVLLNAAAALIVADKAADFADGARQAAAAIDGGAAREKLDAFLRAAREAAE